MTQINVKKSSIGEILSNETNFLDEVTTILSCVSNNLQGLLSDFAIIPTFACLDSELEHLLQETQTLRVNIEFLICSQLQGTHKAMTELHSELVLLRSKYNNLQNEWAKQQEYLGKIQTEIFQFRNQIQQQSQYCATLGAVLGNFVWKASRIPPVVDMLLAGNKVEEFLAIVNGSLVSFMETYVYDNAIPSQCADESQFIMSFCGIVTNIAAAPAGRQFIANNPLGKDLLQQISRILPLIPVPSGNCLKRLLLMALYNTSINQNGLKFLQQQKSLLVAIAHDLQVDSTFELKLMALRLLQCLTFDIPNVTVLKRILNEIPIDMIQPMSKSSEPEIKDVVRDILENINRAQKKYEMPPISEIKNKCGYDKIAEPSRLVMGGKTAKKDDTTKPACPTAMTQYKRNVPYNKCFLLQNST